MQQKNLFEKTEKIIGALAIPIGAAFGFLWSTNWIVSLVGIICFLTVGITLLLISGYRATKNERLRLLASIPKHDYSCIELDCSLPLEYFQKYGKKSTISLIFYNKEIDTQTLVKIKELSSTEEEDAVFRNSKLGNTAVSLSDILLLNEIPFLLSDTLYGKLNQIPDCAEFIKNNEFILFHDIWSSHTN